MNDYVHVVSRTPATHRAVLWEKNGDHPLDHVGEDVTDPISGTTYQRIEGAYVRFYRNPNTPGELMHMPCRRTWHEHGWIDSLNVDICPGSWIVEGLRSGGIAIMSDNRYQKDFVEESK